jgi:hypothetical protein
VKDVKMNEQDIHETLRWFDAYELPQRLEKWRQTRSRLLDKAGESEIDAKLKDDIWEAIDDAESLSLQLYALSELIDLEIKPLQKFVDEYYRDHPDEDDWGDIEDLDEDDWDSDEDDIG